MDESCIRKNNHSVFEILHGERLFVFELSAWQKLVCCNFLHGRIVMCCLKFLRGTKLEQFCVILCVHSTCGSNLLS